MKHANGKRAADAPVPRSGIAAALLAATLTAASPSEVNAGVIQRVEQIRAKFIEYQRAALQQNRRGGLTKVQWWHNWPNWANWGNWYGWLPRLKTHWMWPRV